MALDVYLPKKLESQITAFKTNSGNYNVDYRTTETGDINVLGAAYSRVSADSVIRLNCLPLEASGNHVSGLNSLYNEFPVDVLLQNQSTKQRHFFFMTNPFPIIKVNYSHTEVESISSTQSRLLHYFIFPDQYVDETTYANKILQPVYFSTATKITAGLVNNRDCIELFLQPSTSNFSYKLSGDLFEIAVIVNKQMTSTTSLSVDQVDEKILGIKCLLVKDNSQPPQTETKNRIIAISNTYGQTIGNPVLTSRLTNYNLFYESTNISAPLADAYIVPLKGDENVLISSTITSKVTGVLGELTSNIWSYGELYSKELGTYFACIKFKLPSSPYMDGSDPRKMKVSNNGGKTWAELNNYSTADVNEFTTGIVNYFKSLGIKCYPCDNYTFVLVNLKTDNTILTDFIFQYHPDFKIETVTNLATIKTKNGITIPFTVQSFPENYSPCRVRLYGDEAPDDRSDPLYTEFAFALPLKTSLEELAGVFKNSLSFNVDLETIKTTTSYRFEKLDGTAVEQTVDMSLATEEDVKNLLIAELNDKVTDFTFSIDGTKLKVVRKVVNSAPVVFKFQYTGLTLTTETLYETVNGLNEVIIRGS